MVNLKQVYRDTGYGSIETIHKLSKVPKEEIKDFLMGEDAYTLHKKIRRRFPRNRVIVSGPHSQLQIDLADMSNISKHNDGFRYLLVVINSFTKQAWAQPIENKKPDTVIFALDKILKKQHIESIFTDKGGEFINNKMASYLKSKGIRQMHSENVETKASIAERVILTLKQKLYKYFTDMNTYRYIEYLPKLLKIYNSSYHRSIGMAPNQVNDNNRDMVWNKLYKAKKYKEPFILKVGDKVRISKYKTIYDKSYLPAYTEEIFEVNQILKRKPLLYKLVDFQGEEIKGSFYSFELVKVKENKTYKIEKVLKIKRTPSGTKYYVKWLNWPSKFNSWVDNIQNV